MFRLLRLLFLLALIGGVFYLFHGPLLTKAGEMIVKKDEMKPADAIVVLAGEETERVEHGVRLFKEGWAGKDRIIMAGGPLVWKYSWAVLMKQHAESLGVSPNQILLEDRSRTTEEDAIYTKAVLEKHGLKSIILVTSPYHSKRASIIFRKVLGNDYSIINSPSEKSWFRVEDWWKRRRDRAMVLNEFSKFTWLWLFGLETKQ